MDTKKTVTFDMPPSSLFKIAAYVLSSPFAKVINNKQGDNSIFDTD